MSDIVERLRALEAWIRQPTGEPFNMNTDLFDEAADEITRLRAEVERLRGAKCDYDCRCEVADEITRAELNLSDPVDALDRGLSPAEAAVAHVWGERCSDFGPECLCCRAWAEFDQIATLRADNERLRVALASVEIYLMRGGASRSRIAEIARAALSPTASQEKDND